jgi:hypothetical protein
MRYNRRPCDLLLPAGCEHPAARRVVAWPAQLAPEQDGEVRGRGGHLRQQAQVRSRLLLVAVVLLVWTACLVTFIKKPKCAHVYQYCLLLVLVALWVLMVSALAFALAFALA